MTIDATALPSELLVTPQPLIGFCGLDTARQGVHKAIWEAFSGSLQRKAADRAAVQYKLLPPNYEFPVAKPKRASYEWYHPKGILKRNWMLKHLHVLPSVVVLFQDMEWNDLQWTEKQVQCAGTVQALKNALQERNTRLCLVLLQKAAPLPPGEPVAGEQVAAERAASLTSACGITSKMLFILPHTEHLMGYTLRLESAFLDMAQSYYAQMSKRIRNHRDQLSAAHTTLKIRHQFKLGFVAEMRQDFSTAQKHYFQAYAILDEIRINDSNCVEIKTLAGFLNYKICRLMFKLKTPRDAINQFIIHVEKYKPLVGFKDLAFEHYAWLSTQNSVFAELFCEAIKNGLPALQTQHPGIYYHKSAEYVMKRRDAAQQAFAALLDSGKAAMATINPNPLSLYTEFFGIRAVKTGDLAAEQQANVHLCEQERGYNHSAGIIALLSQAMAQFKIYKCLRFRKKLAIDMAEEYLQSGDHAKALTLYSLMLPDYRQEKWSTIFTDVLLKTLRCALLSASVADYIACSIEALSLRHQSEQKDRLLLLDNLWQVYQGMPPMPRTQLTEESLSLWTSALSSVKSPIPIDFDKVSDVVEMCATFERVQLNNDDVLQLQLIVRVLTDVPLRIRSFHVVLADAGNSQNNYKLEAQKYFCFPHLLQLRAQRGPVDQPKAFEKNMILEPGSYYQFFCSTEAKQFHENTQLHIVRVEALMGTDQIGALLTCSSSYTRQPFRHHTRSRDLDDNVTINPICYIAPTFHLVTQTHLGHGHANGMDGEPAVAPRMLVNEYYPVVINICNPFNVYLMNVGVHISVPGALRNSVFLTTDISPGRQKLHTQIQIDVGELSSQSSNTATYYIFSMAETEIKLQQRLSYTLDVDNAGEGSSGAAGARPSTAPNSSESTPDHDVKSIALSLAAISPVQIEYLDETRLRKSRIDTVTVRCYSDFKFCARFYTLNRKPLNQVYRGENFLLRANTQVLAVDDIEILDSFFICDHNLVQSNYSFKRKKYTSKYNAGDQLESVIVLRTNSKAQDWTTSRDLDQRGKLEGNLSSSKFTRRPPKSHSEENSAPTPPAGISAYMSKSLVAKISTTMTIINSNSAVMSSSLHSEDAKFAEDGAPTDPTMEGVRTTRVVYNKALEAVQGTGHCRGFIKGIYTLEENPSPAPVFGVFCIRWRRANAKEENESKFIISGLDIAEPPLNIHCTIEEKMFVKMPMAFKVVIKNPTTHVLHLIATLSISKADNFICSGHKQLDISIMAYDEKELVYNLYPLQVGWQELPVLSLEYNSKADPQKNDIHNALLDELVLRALPKRVFVLPPLKQQTTK
ncbi:trafficking protein particle complex subunit 11 isoform X1 [Drosophila guanche]|uniref:Trafficking protein particle complex subunit 11 n=1 Tax=Drosophila guanche TaxID=7266 RepID=A0A3B0J8K8_DROGU|nr:trafficking protein particle complex subunit 11 isoform X1 [Drosophila guanche]SPP76212.1 blast:Trafficking protein particle complex subunit 11 [Drosophila guanche]